MRSLLHQVWTFLTKPENRATLGWIGGGAVVVIGGLWTAFSSAPEKAAPSIPPVVSAGEGGTAAGSGVAVGGSVIGSTINNDQ